MARIDSVASERVGCMILARVPGPAVVRYAVWLSLEGKMMISAKSASKIDRAVAVAAAREDSIWGDA